MPASSSSVPRLRSPIGSARSTTGIRKPDLCVFFTPTAIIRRISASCTSVRSPLIAAIATFALKADVWFRRGLLLMLSPDSRANLARCQAEAPLIALCRFPKPALLSQNCGPESIRYKYRMIGLTDEQWERIRSHFPEEHIADGRPGRKPIPTRRVLEAVLWLLNTGEQWHMLPQSYPNYKTVHRRFQAWCRDEILRRLLTDVANELRDRGALDEEECFIDATFVMAKGGGAEIGATKRGKGMKIMAIVDRHGLP